jgi:hypothetical protein
LLPFFSAFFPLFPFPLFFDFLFFPFPFKKSSDDPDTYHVFENGRFIYFSYHMKWFFGKFSPFLDFSGFSAVFGSASSYAIPLRLRRSHSVDGTAQQPVGQLQPEQVAHGEEASDSRRRHVDHVAERVVAERGHEKACKK